MPAGDDDELDAAWRACAARRPDVVVGKDAFAAYLDARRPAELTRRDQLASWCVDDLYLACACLAGEPAALVAFEREVLSLVDVALPGRSRDVVDETRQRLRAMLLVGDGTRAPQLAGYSGRGALRRWIRVVAAREASKVAGVASDEVAIDDEALFDRLAPAGDPVMSAVKRDATVAFKAAFVAALRELSRRDRMLLRLHVLDGLTIDELAPLHDVHRATAARWIAAAKKQVLDATRRGLMHDLRLHGADVDSLIRLVHSRIDLPGDVLASDGDGGD